VSHLRLQVLPRRANEVSPLGHTKFTGRKLTVQCRLAVLALAVWLIPSAPVHATDLRGRVDGRNAYYPRPFPLAGAPVMLYAFRPQFGWRVVATAYTGPDGLYYFRNIPPGSYTLQVQGLNFPLNVAPASYQDVPPVLVSR
jgi:hypothetical protein